jgi:hypothetical protein
MDKANRPIAIQVPYAEWQRIQRLLARRKSPTIRRGSPAANLEKYRGTVKRTEDPIAYQRRCRSEWR